MGERGSEQGVYSMFWAGILRTKVFLAPSLVVYNSKFRIVVFCLLFTEMGHFKLLMQKS